VSGPNEEGPRVAAREPSNQLSEVSTTETLAEQPSVSQDLPSDTGESVTPEEPQILRRIDYPNGDAFICLPVHGGYTDCHALAIFHHSTRDADSRVIEVVQRLWSRGKLPFMVATVDVFPDKLVFGLDLGDPETLPKYQAAFAALSWAFPWRLEAFCLDPAAIKLAEKAGLGLQDRDDAPTGRTL
jgi:hypothetical protein